MAETSPPTNDRTGRDWRVTLAVAGLVLVAVAIRLPNLDAALLGRHGFRETQTAYTAVVYRDEGVSLLHPSCRSSARRSRSRSSSRRSRRSPAS